MKKFLGFALTWALAVATTMLIVFFYVKEHPTPRFGKVDIGTLVQDRIKALGEQIKPDMPKEDQERIMNEANNLGGAVTVAIEQLGNECRCGILNSAAFINDGGGTLDLTDRLKELLEANLKNKPAKADGE
jgi:hypothetical protein